MYILSLDEKETETEQLENLDSREIFESVTGRALCARHRRPRYAGRHLLKSR